MTRSIESKPSGSQTFSRGELMRESCERVWADLHAHPFVRELAAGTLPPEKFRFYIEQNLQYLPEYARAMAIGLAKAADLGTMELFMGFITNILESEIPENRELRRRVIELGAEDRGGADGMAPANVAYTGFLVSTALQGGLLEIMAVILPCAWSYGEIGVALSPNVQEHPVYAEWVRFFSSSEYHEPLEKMRDDFEELTTDADEGTLDRLTGIFAMSARLERSFWDMAYNTANWPDVGTSGT